MTVQTKIPVSQIHVFQFDYQRKKDHFYVFALIIALKQTFIYVDIFNECPDRINSNKDKRTILHYIIVIPRQGN